MKIEEGTVFRVGMLMGSVGGVTIGRRGKMNHNKSENAHDARDRTLPFLKKKTN